MVVKLHEIHLFMVVFLHPDREAVLFRAHRVTHPFGSRILAEGGGFPLEIRLIEQRLETHAFQMRRKGESGEIGQGGKYVHEFHQSLAVLTGRLHTRRGNHEGAVGVVLHITVFSPFAVFAKLPAVVAPQNDDGVLRQILALQFIQNLADLGVGVADGRIVTVLQLARQRIGHRPLGRNPEVIAQFAAAGECIFR